LIMSDVAIEFKSEVFYGEKIIASVAISEFSKFGFEVFYKLEKENTEKRILVVTAKTGMVCYNYVTKKIASVPEEVIKRLK
ncbi:MAG TPA: thioesterase family protein, partial [Chitinophagaceae bacterium]|nr:thioesterase family protein [Chitinophagaceae bacterium]